MTGEIRQPRRARLYITRVDPWSVTKAAFLFALAVGIIFVVAVGLVWWLLDSSGVFVTISRTLDEIIGSATTGFDLLAVLDFSRVMGVAIVLASVEIILVSILATIFAILYNLGVGLTGGIEVVLSDQV